MCDIGNTDPHPPMKTMIAAFAAPLFGIALVASCGGGSSDTTPDAAASAACTDYCTAILANCGTGHAQYSGMDQCMASCAAFPAGNTGDTSGDSVACRTYHAMAAATDPDTHCPHAGPSGDGVCGTDCEGYCDLASTYCVGANQVYTDRAQCMSVCEATPNTVRFVDAADATLEASDQQVCLVYHAQEGSVAPADHCLGDLTLRPAPNDTEGSVTCQ